MANILQRPTLKELNIDGNASKDQLLLLRILCTLDLSITLYKKGTLEDLLKVCDDLLLINPLRGDESEEYEELRTQVQDYIDSQIKGWPWK